MTRCLHSALCRKRKPRRRRWRAEENETLLPQLGRERGRQGRWMARRARGRGTFGHYRHSSVRPSVLPPDWNPRARLAAAAVIGVISKGTDGQSRIYLPRPLLVFSGFEKRSAVPVVVVVALAAGALDRAAAPRSVFGPHFPDITRSLLTLSRAGWPRRLDWGVEKKPAYKKAPNPFPVVSLSPSFSPPAACCELDRISMPVRNTHDFCDITITGAAIRSPSWKRGVFQHLP